MLQWILGQLRPVEYFRPASVLILCGSLEIVVVLGWPIIPATT